jgi:hypothetical protein
LFQTPVRGRGREGSWPVELWRRNYYLFLKNSLYTAPTICTLHSQSVHCTHCLCTALAGCTLHSMSKHCTLSLYTALSLPYSLYSTLYSLSLHRTRCLYTVFTVCSLHSLPKQCTLLTVCTQPIHYVLHLLFAPRRIKYVAKAITTISGDSVEGVSMRTFAY